MNWRPFSTPYPYSYGASVRGALRDVVYMLVIGLLAYACRLRLGAWL